MKNSLLFLFTVYTANVLCAATFTSNSTGPASWNLATSWTVTGVDTDSIPDADDDVIIQSGQTITHSVNSKCRDLTVMGTLHFTAGGLQVWGTTLNNTGTLSGAPYFAIYANGTTISGNGTFGSNVRFIFVKSATIASGTVISTTTGFTIYPIIVTNNGTVTCPNALCYPGAVFVNGTNASLTLTQVGFMAGRTFTASATGNTVALKYGTGAVPTVTGATFYNLSVTATSGTKTLPSNTIITNNLTINSNNTLNSNNFDLTVGGNMVNSGVFTVSTGKTITFNGTTAQSLSGSGISNFSTLALNNTSGLSLLSGSCFLSEVLTLSNGTFNVSGGNFTMLSTATQTARIAPIPTTASISGNFIIQRFISARDTTWADLSSPVQSSTMADWSNDLPAFSYYSGGPSAYTYDEATDVYVPVTSSGTALTPGLGFEVFLSGDYSYANLPATTMNTIGVPNQGDQDFSSSISQASQGWNLVGNPFASSISWASVYAASGGAASGLYDFVEMYDYTIGDWSGYTSADAIEIGSTQGFWVYPDFTAGSLTLLIPESSKTTTSNSSIKSNNRIQPYFTLKLGYADGSVPNSHTFKVAASDLASDGFDNNDLPFRNSPSKATPALYSMVDGKKININTFNSANDSYSMPLKTQVNVSGNYRITAAGFEFMSDYTCIKLQDSHTGQTIDLNEGNGYCFTMNVNDNPDRFILHFSKDDNCKSAVANSTAPLVDFENHIQVLPTSQGNMINFSLSESANTTITVSNMLGQNIVEKMSLIALDQSVNITLPEGYTGMYIIKVESDKGAVTKKFVKK